MDIAGTIQSLKSIKKRRLLIQCLSFGMIIASALMIWKSLMVVTGSESPIVVVLSGSMEPAFYRGDLLFLWNNDQPVSVGDIPVFKLDGREIPIVHRVITVHDKNGTIQVMTKGDNNPVDDRMLYPPGMDSLERRHIIGRAKGYLPLVGMVTILMNDYPQLKYALIAVLGLFVLFGRD